MDNNYPNNQYNPQQNGYPQNNQYNPQQNGYPQNNQYNPQQNGYPQNNQYNPQQNGYPQNNQYNPQQNGYPQNNQYNPQQYGYPQQQFNGGVQPAKKKNGVVPVVIAGVAVLAVAAAITIPVVNAVSNSNRAPTRENSSEFSSAIEEMKLSVFESDAATLNMLIKEAVNTSKASMTNTHWNGKIAAEASVHDICVENNIDDSAGYYSRTINGETYVLVWTDDKNVKIYGGDESTVESDIEWYMNGDVNIADLDRH